MRPDLSPAATQALNDREIRFRLVTAAPGRNHEFFRVSLNNLGTQSPRGKYCAARRLGENDAWLVATAESIDADVVGIESYALASLSSVAMSGVG